MELGAEQWAALVAAALFTGLSKAGLSGLSLIGVLFLAEAFGMASVGLLLPMLIIADLAVYPAYRKDGTWGDALRLLPPALLGVLIGWWLLGVISEEIGRPVIGGVILCMLGLQVMKKWSPVCFKQMSARVSYTWVIASLGGVASTLANAAGPLMQLYLLSKNYEKLRLIGTAARFFLVLNLVKLPLLGQLDLVHRETLKLNAFMIPVILLGVWSGRGIIKSLSPKVFEMIVLVFASLAAARLLFF